MYAYMYTYTKDVSFTFLMVLKNMVIIWSIPYMHAIIHGSDIHSTFISFYHSSSFLKMDTDNGFGGVWTTVTL